MFDAECLTRLLVIRVSQTFNDQPVGGPKMVDPKTLGEDHHSFGMAAAVMGPTSN